MCTITMNKAYLRFDQLCFEFGTEHVSGICLRSFFLSPLLPCPQSSPSVPQPSPSVPQRLLTFLLSTQASPSAPPPPPPASASAPQLLPQHPPPPHPSFFLSSIAFFSPPPPPPPTHSFCLSPPSFSLSSTPPLPLLHPQRNSFSLGHKESATRSPSQFSSWILTSRPSTPAQWRIKNSYLQSWPQKQQQQKTLPPPPPPPTSSHSPLLLSHTSACIPKANHPHWQCQNYQHTEVRQELNFNRVISGPRWRRRRRRRRKAGSEGGQWK